MLSKIFSIRLHYCNTPCNYCNHVFPCGNYLTQVFPVCEWEESKPSGMIWVMSLVSSVCHAPSTTCRGWAWRCPLHCAVGISFLILPNIFTSCLDNCMFLFLTIFFLNTFLYIQCYLEKAVFKKQRASLSTFFVSAV